MCTHESVFVVSEFLCFTLCAHTWPLCTSSLYKLCSCVLCSAGNVVGSLLLRVYVGAEKVIITKYHARIQKRTHDNGFNENYAHNNKCAMGKRPLTACLPTNVSA